jgi:hypothetical protein
MPRTPADEESANTVAAAVLVIADPTDAAAAAALRDLVATAETIAPLVRFTTRPGAVRARHVHRKQDSALYSLLFAQLFFLCSSLLLFATRVPRSASATRD